MQHPVVGADEDYALLLLTRSAGRAIGVLRTKLGAERSAVEAIFVISLNLGCGIDDVPHFPYILRAGIVRGGRAVTVRIAGSVAESGPAGTEAYSPVPAAIKRGAGGVRGGRTITVRMAGSVVETGPVGTEIIYYVGPPHIIYQVLQGQSLPI